MIFLSSPFVPRCMICVAQLGSHEWLTYLAGPPFIVASIMHSSEALNMYVPRFCAKYRFSRISQTSARMISPLYSMIIDPIRHSFTTTVPGSCSSPDRPYSSTPYASSGRPSRIAPSNRTDPIWSEIAAISGSLHAHLQFLIQTLSSLRGSSTGR
ncbi:hypothetical protein PFISCL1PPCAC_12087, partial [Pristionchus fissidentatus]